MADYDHELNEAQKLFWNKIWKDYQDVRDSTQTKIKKVLTDHFGADYNEKIDKMAKETNKSVGVLQAIANIFKFGGGEMERHYPSKKK